MADWRIRSIFHFILPCSNVERSMDFYAHFGFEVAKDNRDVQWPDYVGDNFNMIPGAQGRAVQLVFFANSDSWNALPDRLQELFRVCMDSSHYYRQHWYWGGEAHLRTKGTKLELTSIPDAEWQQVEDEALQFWDEIAQTSPRAARVIDILKQYNATMAKAGRPYRYS